MRKVEVQNATGKRRMFLLLLLPMIVILLIMQSMTVLGQEEAPTGDLPTVGTVGAVKTASHSEVAPGSTVHYTIVISNSGVAEASGINMTDALPAEFSVVAAEVKSLNNATGPTVNVANDVVSWQGTLGAMTGQVEIDIEAVLTDTAVIDDIITNTAEVTGSGVSLSPTADVKVIDEYKTYMPIVFKPLPTPTLSSISVPTSNDAFATYKMTVAWEDLGDATLTYLLEESTDPNFSNPTLYDAGNATSWQVTHSSSTIYRFYYRVRVNRDNLYSNWSNVKIGSGIYRDTFNDNSTGWKMRREDTDDTNNSVSYQNGRLRVKVGGRWDSMITSPLAPIPENWPGYRIHTLVQLGEGIDYLQSYGIVFGGDWNGITPCPNGNFTSCFNRYYRLNIIWQGHDKPFLVHLKRIDSHNTVENTDTGVTLMSHRDLNVSHDVNGWNDWVIDVRNNGQIDLYANGNKFFTVNDTSYVGGGRYFGTFASSVEYLGTAAFHEFYELTPIP